MATRPDLILEGDGDREAVPDFIRRFSEYKVFPQPHPIVRQNVPKLDRDGELEKYVRHALRKGGDAVLLLLDSDATAFECCAKRIVETWVPRIRNMQPNKKVGIGLFVKEYEAYFLACLDRIAVSFDYGWNLDGWDADGDPEAPRGAKEMLTGMMDKSRAYKETRDQASFTSELDFAVLRAKCRSFRHMESLLDWLLDEDGEPVYPSIAGRVLGG